MPAQMNTAGMISSAAAAHTTINTTSVCRNDPLIVLTAAISMSMHQRRKNTLRNALLSMKNEIRNTASAIPNRIQTSIFQSLSL